MINEPLPKPFVHVDGEFHAMTKETVNSICGGEKFWDTSHDYVSNAPVHAAHVAIDKILNDLEHASVDSEHLKEQLAALRQENGKLKEQHATDQRALKSQPSSLYVSDAQQFAELRRKNKYLEECNARQFESITYLQHERVDVGTYRVVADQRDSLLRANASLTARVGELESYTNGSAKTIDELRKANHQLTIKHRVDERLIADVAAQRDRYQGYLRTEKEVSHAKTKEIEGLRAERHQLDETNHNLASECNNLHRAHKGLTDELRAERQRWATVDQSNENISRENARLLRVAVHDAETIRQLRREIAELTKVPFSRPPEVARHTPQDQSLIDGRDSRVKEVYPDCGTTCGPSVLCGPSDICGPTC
jgi:DNA repair exonuclease SbcCD ATPase subunit